MTNSGLARAISKPILIKRRGKRKSCITETRVDEYGSRSRWTKAVLYDCTSYLNSEACAIAEASPYQTIDLLNRNPPEKTIKAVEMLAAKVIKKVVDEDDAEAM